MTSSTRQIIDATLQDNPIAIKAAIEASISEKIAAALEEKKFSIAQNLIGMGESKSPKLAEDIDFASFKEFLAEELELELEDEDVEFLLEDMDQETFDIIVSDYRMALNESKKKVS